MSSSTPTPDGSPEDVLAQSPSAMNRDTIEVVPPRTKPSLTLVLGGVVAAAVLFAGGLLVGPATRASAAPAGNFAAGRQAFQAGQGATPGARAGAGGGGGGGFTSGKITAISGSTITLTTSAGTTITVTTTDATTVSKTVATTLSGLAAGDTVTVIGAAGSNNSIAARAITEGAAGIGGFPRGGSPTPGQTPTN